MQRVPAEVVPLPFYKRPSGTALAAHRAIGRVPAREEEPRWSPDLRYTKEHEWVRVDGEEATIGITAFAAEQLGDMVFVELPDIGRALEQFATFGVVESVKAVSDLFAPGRAARREANEALAECPRARQQRSIRCRLDAPGHGARSRPGGGLLDAEAYDGSIADG